MEKTIPHGALLDPRISYDKEKDYLHNDLYGGLPAIWIEKPRFSWSLPSQRNQSTSLSCVKQSSATAIEKFLKVPISAGTYKLRADKTQGGMYLQNCGDLDYNVGTILESITCSQNMNEVQMNSIILPPTLNIKITGYRTFSNINIESVAEAVQSYGNCILVFHSNSNEWLETPVYLDSPINFGHAICAVDFTLINGVKTLICMDSAAQWSSPTGIRLITEDFLNKRCVGAMYYTGAKTDSIPPMLPSTAPFLVNMSYGQMSVEIKRLQAVLKELGYFPQVQECTGFYGLITTSAIYHFQLDKIQLNPWEYWITKGRMCGKKTREALNNLTK